MRRILIGVAILIYLAGGAASSAAQAKAGAVICVGLYSETDAGYVSYRVGAGAWVVVKIGDSIPANAEIRVNVDRDWIEVRPADNLNAVYEIAGSESGEVIKKVADILKSKPRSVAFPKPNGAVPDPKFKDKLVVTQCLGRQIYLASPESKDKDIKYGDVLDRKGRVTIIAINNTITLMNASGAVTTVIGPLKFDVEKVLTNQNLYKFLNVPK
jgi:hypothetical protein